MSGDVAIPGTAGTATIIAVVDRQQQRRKGYLPVLVPYVMTSIRKLCVHRIYDLCVKPHMYSFTKNVYFWYML